MAVIQGEYPQFPLMECSVCTEQFEVPRKRMVLDALGMQILIDWEAAERLMEAHHQEHNTDLINGLENMLREDAQRRGR